MDRSWKRRDGRPYGSTASVADWSSTATGEGRLSEGAVVRASVLARLLGIRLLRLEADIALVPASPPRLAVAPFAADGGTADLEVAARLLVQASRTLGSGR